MKDSLKVFINKTYSGDLSFGNNKYVYNYEKQVTNVVSLTMPINSCLSPILNSCQKKIKKGLIVKQLTKILIVRLLNLFFNSKFFSKGINFFIKIY